MQAPRVPTHLWCCHRNRSMHNPMPFHYAFEIPLTSAVLFHLLIRAKVGTRTTIAAHVEDQCMWLCCCAMFRPSKIFWRVAVLEEEQCDVCTSSCLTQGGTRDGHCVAEHRQPFRHRLHGTKSHRSQVVSHIWSQSASRPICT